MPMPWKEICAMDQKTQMIKLWRSGRYSLTDLSILHDVSRKTIYMGRLRGHIHPGKTLQNSSGKTAPLYRGGAGRRLRPSQRLMAGRWGIRWSDGHRGMVHPHADDWRLHLDGQKRRYPHQLGYPGAAQIAARCLASGELRSVINEGCQHHGVIQRHREDV